MERLTYRGSSGVAGIVYDKDICGPFVKAGWCKTGCIDGPMRHWQYGCDDQCILGKVINRLACYEDTEEDGRLVVLPCKVGDTVYVINGDHISMAEVTIIRPFVFANRIEFRGNAVVEEVDLFYDDGRLSKRNLYIVFGDDAFLTREEAEAALKGGAE